MKHLTWILLLLTGMLAGCKYDAQFAAEYIEEGVQAKLVRERTWKKNMSYQCKEMAQDFKQEAEKRGLQVEIRNSIHLAHPESHAYVRVWKDGVLVGDYLNYPGWHDSKEREDMALQWYLKYWRKPYEAKS